LLLLLCEQKVKGGRGERWTSNGDWWANDRKCETLAIRVQQAPACMKRRRPPPWRQYSLRCRQGGGGNARDAAHHHPIARNFGRNCDSGSGRIWIEPNGTMCDEFL
jgi:hypothetical protein